MDGIVVQTSLTGSGGVLLVVCIFLFLAETQVTVHQLYRAGGEATVLSISLLLPKEREREAHGSSLAILQPKLLGETAGRF